LGVSAVVEIRGRGAHDVVTQLDLQEMEQLQNVAWTIQRRVLCTIEALRARVDSGAIVERGDLYLDLELAMVRRRRTRGGPKCYS